MRDFTVVIFLIVFCCSSANAVTPEEALASRFRAAAALIDTQMTREAVPGAAMSLVDEGRLSMDAPAASHKLVP